MHCHRAGATAACLECERIFHTLCMQPPALKATDLPDSMWSCPFCGHTNQVARCTAVVHSRDLIESHSA